MTRPVIERAAWVVVVTLLALRAYAPTLATGFSDADGLADVAWAGRPLADQLLVPLTGGVGGTNANFWRPAAMAWYWLQRRLFGLDAAAWHAADLGLHVLTTLLAAEWAARTARLTGRPERGWRWGVALLYVAHPLAVEVVPATARSLDLLLGVGFFGALLGLALGAERVREGRPSAWAWLGSGAAALLALGSKESAVLLLPVAAAWIALFRDDLPARARALHALGVLGPALLVLPAWLATRATVLDGVGGYFADGETVRASRLGWALARGFVEPLLPSLSTLLGTHPPPFAFAIPLVGSALVLAWGHRSPDRRLLWLVLGAWALFVLLFGATGVYTRRVLYVPAGFACVALCFVIRETWTRRSGLAGALVAAWGLSFLHGTPALRRYEDWAVVTRAADQLAEAVVALELPAGSRVWLVDRPYRASLDPRGFRLWSTSRSLVHGATTYSLEAWRSDRRPDAPLDLRTLTRWELTAPPRPAHLALDGGQLVVRREGGVRKLSSSADFEVVEADGALRLTPRARVTVLVWDPAGPRAWTFGEGAPPAATREAGD